MRNIALGVVVALAASALTAQSSAMGEVKGTPEHPNFLGLERNQSPANILGPYVLDVSCRPSQTSIGMTWPKALMNNGVPVHDFLLVFNDGYRIKYYVPLPGNTTSYTYEIKQTGNRAGVVATVFKSTLKDGKHVYMHRQSASLSYTKANGGFGCRVIWGAHRGVVTGR